MDYINNIIKVFESDGNVNFVYVFGSQVKDKIRFGSDLDIAVFFTSEPGIMEVGTLCSELEKEACIKIDLVKLNSLYDSNPELAYNILNEGSLIFKRDNEMVYEYKKNVILRYLDFKPVRDKFHSLFLERLSKNKFAVK
ncbi:MAG: nucleotidyltransferase domain-containing protein [Bacteroidota bacterium]